MEFDQGLDQGEAEARPAPFATDEAIKYVRLDVEGNAAPRVGDLHLDLAQGPAGAQGDSTALRGLTQGVHDQVVEYLRQPPGVAPHQAEIVGAFRHQPDLRSLRLVGPAHCRRLEEASDVHVLEVERHLPGVDLRHVEDVVD